MIDVVISKLCFISGPRKEKKNRGHCLKKTEHAFFLFFFSNKFGFTKNFIMKHIENYLDLVVYTFFGWLNYDIYLSDNDKTSPLMINCMLVYFYATLVSMSDSNITNLQHGEYQCLLYVSQYRLMLFLWRDCSHLALHSFETRKGKHPIYR